jgi:hypothetical protein
MLKIITTAHFHRQKANKTGEIDLDPSVMNFV